MFVGHIAVALAAKRATPDVNVGWLVAGVTALDLLWPIALLAGVEHVRVAPGATAFTPLVFESYPWTHSFVMAVVWGVVLVGIARVCKVTAVRASVLVALVVSHWVLDFLTHAPDMPLWPGASSPKFGLALWNSIPATLVIEGAMWIAAIAMFIRATPNATRGSRVALWSLVALTTLVWASGPWMPPPPSQTAIGWFGLLGWMIVPWAAAAEPPVRQPAHRDDPA